MSVSYTHLDVYKRQTLDIPVVVFAENATSILKSSAVVEIDAARGTVSCGKGES